MNKPEPNHELKSWRTKEGLTQIEAAKRFGVPYRTYCNWEYGIVAKLPRPVQKLFAMLSAGN